MLKEIIIERRKYATVQFLSTIYLGSIANKFAICIGIIMKYSQYKYNFYLNASHAIYINGNKGERHPHTWQISLYVVNNKDTFMMFNEVEKLIEDYLGQYQEKYINECPIFKSMNPTLENIAHCFMDELQKILNPLNWVIFTMEISETPSRSYIISNVDNNIIHDVEKRNIAEEILKRNGIH